MIEVQIIEVGLYCIVGNFRGIRYSWMGDLYHFTGWIFADAHIHTHYALYNWACLIFVVSQLSAKTENWTPQKFPTIRYLYVIRSAHDCHSIKIQRKELLMFSSITCKSFMGFQSCSKKMTVSAPVRLRPNPPTWVVRRRTSMEGSLLNLQKESKIDSQIRTDTNNSYTRTKAMCITMLIWCSDWWPLPESHVKIKL